MDHIVSLDGRQEAALQAVADKFVATHKGDVMKALKAMIVLNGHLQEQLGASAGLPERPRRAAR
ncbi:MAG: hypothetical protein EOR30_16895 [Mesorhizobium sp.]|uniref:hypothetical protein n=1 Tax=unclassified Mesorhizobium TaxID=325217 RepID=UPI000FCB3BFA|nr:MULTISPECIES: hypothetical protein [unclassified Mesorhizobium]RUV75954.1 hypothetical protein EOA78_04960 [Mesorhizobium sp. M5C.F.Cr.IN.023.01.1.1]RWF85761.1 MAG: hypothetical protein EOQ36_20855 [Mesorhizobium sp.]RWF95258.1 MAG: hypothetical protein EOQ45_07960 [Mesorhizobium sp.]RWI39909.1 MAG: hypothetical protein EOR14_17690 [Mesorhizobium sp.]RWI45227.1 MAG: hypothetical protein EOR15_22350 [Mesorhizobium sp.]